MNNSQRTNPDPVYEAILQTHTDSLKRYLSLAPTLKTPPQRKKNLTDQYYQEYQIQSTTVESHKLI